MQRPSRDEQGSTLIELLIATMISIALIAVVAMTFTMGQRTNANTGTLLSESNDAQLVATYLPADLQSVSSAAGSIIIGNGAATPTQNGPSAIGTGCTPEPANDADHFNALRLNWTQSDGTPVRTSYRTEKVGSATEPEWQLVRYSCKGATPDPTIVVARNLKAPAVSEPGPLCTAPPPPPPPPPPPLPPPPPSPLPVPVYVTACNGTAANPSALNVSMTLTDISGYSYVVSGSRRTPPPGPLHHFLVSVPDSATVGEPFDVTVTAKDINNYTVDTYVGAINVGSTLTATPTSTNFDDTDNGVHVFAMTVNATGTTTISATKGSITGTSLPLVVNPLVLDHFNIETPDTVTQNEPFSVKVTAQDRLNHTVTTYTGRVVFFITLPDAASIPSSYDFVAGDAGKRTFDNLRWLNVTPQATLNVKDFVATGKTGIATFAVIPGPAVGSFALSTTTPSPRAGTVAKLTVTAKTVSGTTDTSYLGTVRFTSNDAQATVGGVGLPTYSYTFTVADIGAHTFDITLRTAGSIAVTATDTLNPARTDTTFYTVGIARPVTITLETCVVPGPPPTTTCGTSFNIGGLGGTLTANVRATDPFGNVPASASISSNDSDFEVNRSVLTFAAGSPVSETFTVTHKKAAGGGVATVTVSVGSDMLTFKVKQ